MSVILYYCANAAEWPAMREGVADRNAHNTPFRCAVERLSGKTLMENVDETHLNVNLENGRTLGLRGDVTVKFAEVVSGGDSITMVIKISRGRQATIEAPMLILTSKT